MAGRASDLPRVLRTNGGPMTLVFFLAGAAVTGIYLFNTYWIGMRNMMYANA